MRQNSSSAVSLRRRARQLFAIRRFLLIFRADANRSRRWSSLCRAIPEADPFFACITDLRIESV